MVISIVMHICIIVFILILAESISARLIKFLIPATFVPEKAIVKTISYLCTNKPSTNMQVNICTMY